MARLTDGGLMGIIKALDGMGGFSAKDMFFRPKTTTSKPLESKATSETLPVSKIAELDATERAVLNDLKVESDFLKTLASAASKSEESKRAMARARGYRPSAVTDTWESRDGTLRGDPEQLMRLERAFGGRRRAYAEDAQRWSESRIKEMAEKELQEKRELEVEAAKREKERIAAEAQREKEQLDEALHLIDMPEGAGSW